MKLVPPETPFAKKKEKKYVPCKTYLDLRQRKCKKPASTFKGKERDGCSLCLARGDAGFQTTLLLLL